ncbi:MAG: DUF4294 domain-containing protein [Ferruginibacter sp.]|nr:DUF4294 domain-containing protein [Ferruginibacter sp.]
MLFFLFSLLLGNSKSFAQYSVNDTINVQAFMYQGELMTLSVLSNVYVYCKLTKAQKEAIAAYNRLRNAVYVTYPYARKAGILMNEMNAHLSGITDKSLRKKYIKTREKELRKEFTIPLTNLSVYQGKVLMKLINRETGNNCYEIIKEYQGGLAAGFYQTVAFFFSTSLKQSYDPFSADALIERFVIEVQRLYGFNEISKSSSLMP